MMKRKYEQKKKIKRERDKHITTHNKKKKH